MSGSYQIKVKSVEKDLNRIHVKAEISGAGGTIPLDYMYYTSMGHMQGLNNYLNGKNDAKYNIPTVIRTDLVDRIGRILAGRSYGDSKNTSPKRNTTIAHSYTVKRSDSFFG